MARESGNGRPPLEKDDEVRVPMDLLHEPEVTLAIVKVYATVRAHVGFDQAADNFSIARPSIPTLVKKTGLHRATVIAALAWLEQYDFIVKDRRPNRSTIYTVILWRRQFLQTATVAGRAEAIEEYRAWCHKLGEESRSGQAKAAAERRAGQARARGRKSPGDDRRRSGLSTGSPGDDRPGRPETTSVVAAGRPTTSPGGDPICVAVDLCSSDLGPVNCGAAGAAPPPAPEHHQDDGKSNGHDEQQPPRRRPTPGEESYDRAFPDKLPNTDEEIRRYNAWLIAFEKEIGMAS